MKSPFFLAGALTLALAAGTLLMPGCGGGGSNSSVPNLRFGRQKSVQFLDFPGFQGILRVNFADSSSFPARATGTLQVVAAPIATPTPTSPNAPTPTPDPSRGFSVGLPPGTYILTGDVLDGSGGFDYDLDLRGSYEGGPQFRLTGNFDDQGLIFIRAPFQSGNSVLRGRVVPLQTNTTAGATTGATTGNTTGSTTATTGATTAGATTGSTTGSTTATTGSTIAGNTAGNTTAGATTGSTTATTTGSTNAGNTAGATTGATTAGAGTAGDTTAGATTAGSTLGGDTSGTTNPPRTS